MSPLIQMPAALRSRLRQLRWRLTVSYALVALGTVLMVEWWGLVGASLFLSGSLSPQAFLVEVARIAVTVVLPTALVLVIPTGLVGALLGQVTAHWLNRRLLALSQAGQAWQAGDFSRRITDTTGDEITLLAGQLNAMAGQLAELIQARQNLAGLEERSRLARELHDSVKQEGLAALMQIGAARARLAGDPSAAAAALQEAEALVHQMQQELTGLIWELRPVGLSGRGLRPALQAAVETWSRQTRIPAGVTFTGEPDLPPALEETLFRIMQEALANVARHSRASQARLELAVAPAEVILTVTDDGVGFEPQAVGQVELGLRSMRERAAAAGGSLVLESAPGHGTALTVRLPLPS